MTSLNDLLVAGRGPSAPGEIRITLTNSAQGAHLFQTLRGHCDVDMLSGSEGTAVVVWGGSSGGRPVLRRLDAWMSEFGVETLSIELDGRTYEMRKAAHGTARVLAAAGDRRERATNL